MAGGVTAPRWCAAMRKIHSLLCLRAAKAIRSGRAPEKSAPVRTDKKTFRASIRGIRKRPFRRPAILHLPQRVLRDGSEAPLQATIRVGNR